MDYHVHAEDFSTIHEPHAWYNHTSVRVDYVWKDKRENKLYLILHDKNRAKMTAVVPGRLVHLYETRNLIGEVFQLDHYKIEYTDTSFYPRYESYSFVRGEWEITISKNTTLTKPKDNIIENEFPLYPFVTSIGALANDRSPRKMMLDVVGKIIWGHLIKNTCSCNIFLQDRTGRIIYMILTDTPRARPLMIAQAINENQIIYVSRVKLIHHRIYRNLNYLESTYLSNIVFEPLMPEATDIRNMSI